MNRRQLSALVASIVGSFCGLVGTSVPGDAGWAILVAGAALVGYGIGVLVGEG